MAYDELDKRVLSALRRNCRKQVRQYTAETSSPKSTVHDRICRLARSGTRFVALLDWERVGCPFSMIAFTPYEEKLAEHAAVNTCSLVAPNLMFLVCLFSTVRELEEFRQENPRAKLYPVVQVMKQEGFVPL